MANDAFLDALAAEIVSTESGQSRLDALAVEVVSTESGQSRLDAFVVELVWTGTGILPIMVNAQQLDLGSGHFESAGEYSRQLTMSNDAVTANKIAFDWRTVEIPASKFQYDGTTRSYYTLTTGPVATNSPLLEQPTLARNGVNDLTKVTTTAGTKQWSISGSVLAVHGDVTASGDTYTLRYIVHDTLKDGILLQADTTDATPTYLTTDGGAEAVSNIVRLEDDSTLLCRIYLVARRTDANDESASFIYEVVLDRNAGAATTALVGSPRTVFSAQDGSWTIGISANTTLGGLRVLATGEAAKSISWRAFIVLQPVRG